MAQRSVAVKAKGASGTASRRLKVVMLIGGGFFLTFLVLAFVGIQAWEYSNSVAFCTEACHDVHPEEPIAYENSYHAEVQCTECHMGRVSTLRAITIKAGHFRHLPAMPFDNYERPTESTSMRPAYKRHRPS